MKKNTLAAALVFAMAGVAGAPVAAEAPRSSVLRVQALAAGEAELMIYGPIGNDFWSESVTAQSVVSQLSGINATTIHVRINSDGGSVPDGLAIYNALKRHSARKVVTIDGLAASIASLIAMAGDDVVMPANSLMMIHAPWTYAAGNSAQLREAAGVLDTYADAMSTSYASKTGKTTDEIKALFADGADHYYTAAQAVDMGFANRIAEAATENIDENTSAAAALLSYVNAISKAPAAICATLRRKIQAAASPRIFAAIPAAIQRSVVDQIEDATMKLNLLQIMAAAAGGPANPANPAPPPALAAQPPAATDPVQAAMAAIAARNTQVRGIFAGFRDLQGTADLEAQCLADPSLTIEQIQAKLLTKVGAGGAPLTPPGGSRDPRIEAGTDESDKFRAAASNAIVARVRVGAGPVEKLDPANPYRGLGLQALVRQSLVRAGVRDVIVMDGVRLADRVFALHSSSDFPLILANSANKILRAAYEGTPSTWQMWCAQGEVSDFKANSRLSMGSFNSLLVVPPGQEYNFEGTFEEEGETMTATTKGRGLAMTRQMIINDDLGAFIQRARALGAAARRTVNEDVYALLAANGNMSDGGALFNATAVTATGGHANYTSSGTAISVASIAVGEGLMALQKDPGLKTTLGLSPRYILAPRGKKQVAWDILNSPTDPASSNSAKRNYAASLGLELITDAELDKASGTAWYLAADQNIEPLIEVDFLNGQDTPTVEENIDFKTDAILAKVRLDYGVAATGWRGGYKNAGA